MRPPILLGDFSFTLTQEGPGEIGDNVMMLEICNIARRSLAR